MMPIYIIKKNSQTDLLKKVAKNKRKYQKTQVRQRQNKNYSSNLMRGLFEKHGVFNGE